MRTIVALVMILFVPAGAGLIAQASFPKTLPFQGRLVKQVGGNANGAFNLALVDVASGSLEDLRRESVIGFDTETRPAFRRGESYLPSLVQLATAQAVYLVQVQHGMQLK